MPTPTTPVPASMEGQLLTGTVKSVLSGDTVIIRSNPMGCAPPERKLTLAYVVAPKLAERPKAKEEPGTKDEPYAWHARENLRQLVIGREVKFRVAYNTGNGNHDFGQIFVNNIDVGQRLVSNGLLKVKESNKMEPVHKILKDLEADSIRAGKGMYSENKNTMRNITWFINEADLKSYVGREFDAVVEYVRDAGTVRVFFLPSFVYATITFSGIKTPTQNRDGTNQLYYEEAKYFTEVRLLNRYVKVQIQGVANGVFLGTVIHPAGNISECLLKEGFAQIQEWSLSVCPVNIQASYRAAENFSKSIKLRLFADYNPSNDRASVKQTLTGRVIEILNGESIMVKLDDGTTQRYHFSSLRQVKGDEKFAKKFWDSQKALGQSNDQVAEKSAKKDDKAPEDDKNNKKKGKNSDGQSINLKVFATPWLWEAREFLRLKLINKKVNILVDYVKPAEDNYPEKTHATVLASAGGDVGEELIRKGLARVLYHRMDDDDRSSRYEALRSADEQAASAKIGVHGDLMKAPLHKVTDISTAKLARSFLPIIQHNKERIPAIVEYVIHAAKIRLFLPNDNCFISLLIGGISCPRGGNRDDGEPFAKESYELTKELTFQRDCDVLIDGLDKIGNYTGALWVGNKSTGYKNLALELVKTGYASVHASARFLPFKQDLYDAEKVCKDGKVNIWQNYVEEVKVEVTDDDDDNETVAGNSVAKNAKAPTPKKLDHVKVCDVVTPGHLWVQNVEGQEKSLELLNKLSTVMDETPPSSAFKPTEKTVVACKFLDGKWYRANVETIYEDTVPATADIFYIDYGNRESKDLSELYMLPAEFSLDKLKPLAYQVYLAGIEIPEDDDWLEISTNYTIDLAIDKEFYLHTEMKVDVDVHNVDVTSGKRTTTTHKNKHFVTMTEIATQNDLASSILAEGLATVSAFKREFSKLKPLLEKYEAIQSIALASRKNMWEYGDFRPQHTPDWGAPGK